MKSKTALGFIVILAIIIVGIIIFSFIPRIATLEGRSFPTSMGIPTTIQTHLDIATLASPPADHLIGTSTPVATIPLIATAVPTFTSSTPNSVITGSFRFISWGDSQDENENLSTAAKQASSLDPAFTIFNGDLESDGVVSDRMNIMTAAFGSLYPQTFLIRGNHDDHVSGSAGLWESYFTALNRPLPSGASNYVAMNASSTYLTYSFDFSNSRFIGVDVPGDADLLTSAELAFLDNRLTDAENLGLTHAFIYFHGPEYCVESGHCSCSSANDGSCTPAAFVAIINKHPIVSATFHGHEHILGWVHMDSSRVAGLTHNYEEFLTSPSGGWTYNDNIYPARLDYYYPDMGTSQGFAAIDVNGASFTVNIYKVGTTAPVWSRTFAKSGTASMVIPSVTNAFPNQAYTPTYRLVANQFSLKE